MSDEPNGRMDRLERRIERLEESSGNHINRSEVWSMLGALAAILLTIIAILQFATS